jgi:hypothetical protein
LGGSVAGQLPVNLLQERNAPTAAGSSAPAFGHLAWYDWLNPLGEIH